MKTLLLGITLLTSMSAYSSIVGTIQSIDKNIKELKFQVSATYRGEKLASSLISASIKYRSNPRQYPCSQAGFWGDFGFESNFYGKTIDVRKENIGEEGLAFSLSKRKPLCEYNLETVSTYLKFVSPLNPSVKVSTDMSFIYNLFRTNENEKLNYADYRGATINLECRLEEYYCKETIDRSNLREDKVTQINVEIID